MAFGQVPRVVARKFATSSVARSQHWQQHGIPGSVSRRFIIFISVPRSVDIFSDVQLMSFEGHRSSFCHHHQ